MNDWNGNGKYDMSDSFMDYHMANSGSSGASSDWYFHFLGNIDFCINGKNKNKMYH